MHCPHSMWTHTIRGYALSTRYVDTYDTRFLTVNIVGLLLFALWCRPKEKSSNPSNTRSQPNVGLMLGQRLRRWAKMTPAMGQRLVLFYGFKLSFNGPQTLGYLPVSRVITRINCLECPIIQLLTVVGAVIYLINQWDICRRRIWLYCWSCNCRAFKFSRFCDFSRSLKFANFRFSFVALLQ